jgi:serine/threonine protein kinase
VIEQIGRGSYGLVFSAIERHTKREVAIKKIVDVF